MCAEKVPYRGVIGKLKDGTPLLDWDFTRKGMLLARIDVNFPCTYTLDQREQVMEEVLAHVRDDTKPLPAIATLFSSVLPSRICLVKSINMRTNAQDSIPDNAHLFVMGEIVDQP